MVHKIDSNYPSVVDLFEHYNELVKTLVRTSRASDATNVNRSAGKPKWKQNKAHVQSCTAEGRDKPNKQPDSTLENFQTSSLPSQTVSNTTKGNGTEKNRYCKFCAVKGHSMLACSKYVSRCQKRKMFKCYTFVPFVPVISMMMQTVLEYKTICPLSVSNVKAKVTFQHYAIKGMKVFLQIFALIHSILTKTLNSTCCLLFLFYFHAVKLNVKSGA